MYRVKIFIPVIFYFFCKISIFGVEDVVQPLPSGSSLTEQDFLNVNGIICCWNSREQMNQYFIAVQRIREGINHFPSLPDLLRQENAGFPVIDSQFFRTPQYLFLEILTDTQTQHMKFSRLYSPFGEVPLLSRKTCRTASLFPIDFLKYIQDILDVENVSSIVQTCGFINYKNKRLYNLGKYEERYDKETDRGLFLVKKFKHEPLYSLPTPSEVEYLSIFYTVFNNEIQEQKDREMLETLIQANGAG